MITHHTEGVSDTNPNSDLRLDSHVQTNQPLNLVPKFSDDDHGSFFSGLMLSLALSSRRAICSIPISKGTALNSNYFSQESQTIPISIDKRLKNIIEKIFTLGSLEFFQDGEYSQFSYSMMGFLNQYGHSALRVLADYLFFQDPSPTVVAEALNWIGEVRDASTKDERWIILERMLFSPSARIRNGAVLGFAVLDDANAIPIISQASDLEPLPEIKELMAQVIHQLKEK